MLKVNLRELINNNKIKKGAQKIDVPITKVNGDGGKYDGQTYRIPLEYLYYNNQNGRIGSALSKFESESGSLVPGHNEEYNSAIQKMIVTETDKVKKEMDKLVRDIATKGQGIPGYVLNDGRVIDGNRRFTAKRILDQDDEISETQFFEAVLLDELDVENSHDRKLIKELELTIQFGQLGKLDYNPIDRAIDAYKAISINKLMTAKQYADAANMKISEVDTKIYEAELIVKFLEFINASPENYSLAKDLELDGPLQNLVPKYKKNIRGAKNESEILGALFTKIVEIRSKQGTEADFKAVFRPLLKNVIGTRSEDAFVAEMEESVETMEDFFDEEETINSTSDLLNRISENTDVIQALSETSMITRKHTQMAENATDKDKPLKLIEDAKNKLNSIDQTTLEIYQGAELEMALLKLSELSEIVRELQEKLEE